MKGVACRDEPTENYYYYYYYLKWLQGAFFASFKIISLVSRFTTLLF